MINDEKDPNTGRYDEDDNEYKRDQANGNLGDPTAKRNIGPNGLTERKNQKDNLSNLHIGGNEVTGYGANDHVNAGENAQGPGFEAEGSEYTTDQANLREQQEPDPKYQDRKTEDLNEEDTTGAKPQNS